MQAKVDEKDHFGRYLAVTWAILHGFLSDLLPSVSYVLENKFTKPWRGKFHMDNSNCDFVNFAQNGTEPV